MRLISASIKGFGRLVNAKINLDSKVIAIVGPNEAGKTTLLKALAHVDSDEAIPLPQRSRASSVADGTTIVSLDYVLDADDLGALSGIELESLPRRMTVGRLAQGGSVTVRLEPKPMKSKKPLREAVEVMRRTAKRGKALEKWIDPDTIYADPHSDAARDYLAELDALIAAIDMTLSDQEALQALAGSARDLLGATVDEKPTERLRDALGSVVAWDELADPGDRVRTILWKRSPDLLMFTEVDRTLTSAYTLDSNLLGGIPAALGNLVDMAGLKLSELHTYLQSGDVARRDTALAQANRRLEAVFHDAWKQAKLAVRLSVDGGFLRIGIWEDGDNITVFDERSAGLRMFVALIAFLKMHAAERPPILLIDEAESHLHIDAQADLVNMFVNQDQVAKVIYTTHSPACLPPDLGTSIRSVVPRSDNPQISDVKNSFWQGSAGYTPLMLAMGAGAAAFTPARCVLLAEGATEMILLPSLLRAAIPAESLPYQIAPGLSEVPRDFYPQLDLEGARVAYLVDGDDGGDSLAKGLMGSGVPQNLVIKVDAPGIENLIEYSAYVDAATALLTECNPGVTIPSLSTLTLSESTSWASSLDKWAESEGLRSPSKVAIANWLVENERVQPSADGRRQLKRIDAEARRALGLADPSRPR